MLDSSAEWLPEHTAQCSPRARDSMPLSKWWSSVNFDAKIEHVGTKFFEISRSFMSREQIFEFCITKKVMSTKRKKGISGNVFFNFAERA